MKTDNLIPTCQDYSRLLMRAVDKFKITIEEARDRYGLFTYGQWQEVLNEN